MRRLITLVFVAVVAVVAVVAASCAQTANVEQEKAALMAVDADWAKAAKNVDTFVSFLAPDGTIALAGAPAMKGVTVVRAAFRPRPGYGHLAGLAKSLPSSCEIRRCWRTHDVEDLGSKKARSSAAAASSGPRRSSRVTTSGWVPLSSSFGSRT